MRFSFQFYTWTFEEKELLKKKRRPIFCKITKSFKERKHTGVRNREKWRHRTKESKRERDEVKKRRCLSLQLSFSFSHFYPLFSLFTLCMSLFNTCFVTSSPTKKQRSYLFLSLLFECLLSSSFVCLYLVSSSIEEIALGREQRRDIKAVRQRERNTK